MTILGRFPTACCGCSQGTAETNERLRQQAAQQGHRAERLVFADKFGNADHLARYSARDLFLAYIPLISRIRRPTPCGWACRS